MTEITATFEKTFEALIEAKKYSAIKEILNTLRPADIAIILQNVEKSKLPLLFRLLPKETAAETFVEMESDEQELLIRSFSDAELKEVVDELYVDDAVDIVEEMPANVQNPQDFVRCSPLQTQMRAQRSGSHLKIKKRKVRA